MGRSDDDDLGCKNTITGLAELLMLQRDAVNIKSSRWLNMREDKKGRAGMLVDISQGLTNVRFLRLMQNGNLVATGD